MLSTESEEGRISMPSLGVRSPRVSVIIPTYNSGRFLPQTLDSVFNQNFDDLEVIVIDDGSTDDTKEVLRPYERRICYSYQEIAGSAAARNSGLELARGSR